MGSTAARRSSASMRTRRFASSWHASTSSTRRGRRPRPRRRDARVRDAVIVDWIARLAYRAAYLLARAWWFLRRPETRGSVVALWHDGRVLLVRTSYRRQYTLPGGFMKRG